MGRKKLFSLIEIAVAMAVAAIGVAAIMALLPIAVKSTSDSVGDTLAADAANTVIAQLDRAAWEHFDWIQNLKTTKPQNFSEKACQDYAGRDLDENSYKIEPATGLQNGHFAFLFGPPNKKSDFAAEVICWRDQDSSLKISSLNAKTGAPTQITVSNIKYPAGAAGGSGSTSKAPFIRVYIEITWPINKPYTKNDKFPRQSRTFVREYLDPAYYKPVAN